MNIVAAVEVCYSSGVVTEFNLDAVVVQLVLLAEEGVGSHEDALLVAVVSGIEDDVAGEGELVVVEAPDVHVVDFGNALDLAEVFADAFNAQMGRHGLEDKLHALPKHQARGVHHDTGEENRACRVQPPQFRPEEDDRCGEDHTHRVQQVTQDVQEGSLHI